MLVIKNFPMKKLELLLCILPDFLKFEDFFFAKFCKCVVRDYLDLE